MVQVLGRLDGDRLDLQVPALVGQLNDPDRDVRAAVVKAIANLPPEKLV